MTIKEFKELQRASYKSVDTEEWLDIHFTRPIGLAFALLWKRVGVTPNMVTIMSFFLGAGAGWMFYHTDLVSNICGVVLLMFANFCDSTDGQLARLTNQKSLIGRMLDGVASDVWFFCCYLGITLRLQNELIPGTDIRWGIGIWLLCALAGLFAHATQCRLSDYYRQIHLYFLLGKEGSELDSSESQAVLRDEYKKEKKWLPYLFFYNYTNYCKAQEKATPNFQRLHKALLDKYGSVDKFPQEFRDEFRKNSLPLMKYTNILTHNCRAIMLFIGCLANCPWIYPLFEVTVLVAIYVYMHKTHEKFCMKLIYNV